MQYLSAIILVCTGVFRLVRNTTILAKQYGKFRTHSFIVHSVLHYVLEGDRADFGFILVSHMGSASAYYVVAKHRLLSYCCKYIFRG